MQHNNMFNYKNYRYFKWAVVVILVAFAAYLLFEPAVGHYGGRWLGYGLGTISAVSYTHLDVYKRQHYFFSFLTSIKS